MHRIGYFVRALLLLLAVGGCSRSPLVQGTGRVTYNGAPVPNAWVTFVPDEQGKRASHGLTDDDGKFLLTFSRAETGVLRGKHTVFLKYRAAADDEPQRAKTSRELKDVIARYDDPRTSSLHYEVTSDGQHFDIHLE